MTTATATEAAKLITSREYVLPPAPIHPTLTVARAALKAAIADVSRAMAGKSSLPVLSMILLRAEVGQLILTATDLDLVISRQIAARSRESWTLCVPGKLLADVVAALPEGDVSMEHIGTAICLKAGNFESTIKGMEAEEFPTLPSVDQGDSFSMPAQVFAEAIKASAMCAATSTDRPALTGIWMSVQEHHVSFSAADGYQLARISVRLEEAAPKAISEIIPANALTEIAAMLADGDLTITITPTVALLEANGMQAITRLIDGKYPDIERAIPKSSTLVATCKRAEFVASLKLAAFFATQASNVVRANITEAGITLTANAAEVGDQRAEIDARVTGPEMLLAFNVKFAQEIISAIHTDEITIATNSSNAPIVIRPVGLEDALYILRPMTIK